MLDNFYKRLCVYKDRGYIAFTDEDPPRVSYDAALWILLATDIYDSITTISDYHVLVHEYILTDDSGKQFTEDEATIFIMECAVGKQSVTRQYFKAIERYVIHHHEEALLLEHRRDLEGDRYDS